MDNSKAKQWRIGIDAVSPPERDFSATNQLINQISERQSFQSKDECQFRSNKCPSAMRQGLAPVAALEIWLVESAAEALTL